MPLTHSSPLPRASKRRTKESAMNKYAVLARTQWQRYAPTRLAALPEPDEFFARLWELVEAHVSDWSVPDKVDSCLGCEFKYVSVA